MYSRSSPVVAIRLTRDVRLCAVIVKDTITTYLSHCMVIYNASYISINVSYFVCFSLILIVTTRACVGMSASVVNLFAPRLLFYIQTTEQLFWEWNDVQPTFYDTQASSLLEGRYIECRNRFSTFLFEMGVLLSF